MGHTSKKHNIDFMFLMILFLLFTFSAVSVLLMAVNSYRSVVNSNDESTNARAATAYIREVVHKNDVASLVGITNIDGDACIVIEDESGDYKRFIYMYDGYLMELAAKDESAVDPSFGDKILQVNSFEVSWEKQGEVLETVIEDIDGNTHTTYISLKSGGM